MLDDGKRKIAADVAFSEEQWEALTDDLRGLWRDSYSDPSLPDMDLNERIELFLQMRSAEWQLELPEHLRGLDLDDDVPF